MNGKVLSFLLLTAASTGANAQVTAVVATNQQKIQVHPELRSTQPGFQAGIVIADTVHHKLKVWVNNRDEKRFIVAIQAKGNVLWKGSYNDAIYAQVFDLSSLDDGDYVVRIQCERQMVEKPITIESRTYTHRAIRARENGVGF